MNTQAGSTSAQSVSDDVILQAAKEVAERSKIVEEAIAALATDPGAFFEDKVLDALRAIRAANPAEFARIRSRAKKANKALRINELDRLMRPEEGAFHEKDIDRLIGLARERCALSHTSDRRGVAVIDRNSHREVWLVRGTGFVEWLQAEYFEEYEAGVGAATIDAALNNIEAIAANRGPLVEVHIRCAKDGDGYVVDLCDERWRAIRIDATGWRILARSPVLFTRNNTMRPLPIPEHGGSLDLLWKYANVPPAQRPLVIAFMLDAMRPDTPFPVLEIVGEQGSAKSTTQRFLRDLVDPNKVPLRASPNDTEDIFVAAANNWMVSYENLSWLRNEAQDAVCTLSTGGGYATRKFYTNGEEHLLETKRPVMLNSISGVCSRPDLIERTIRVDAPSIPPSERREESELAEGWKEDAQKIQGALFDRFAKALAILPKVALVNRQRMADYERLGEAAMRAGGDAPGTFSELYGKAVREGIELALENYGIVSALLSLMENPESKRRGKWTGTVGQLGTQLWDEGRNGDHSNWPKSAKGLGDQLRRLAPALRAQGLEVEFGERSNKGRQITITRRQDEPQSESPTAVALTLVPTAGPAKSPVPRKAAATPAPKPALVEVVAKKI